MNQYDPISRLKKIALTPDNTLMTDSNWKHFDLMLDPICVVSNDHRLLYINESFGNLYEISGRVLSRQPELSQVARFPKEILQLIQAAEADADRTGRYSEMGVSNNEGSETRMQVRVDHIDGGWIVVLHDVDIEYRLHMKYKEQLANNQSLIDNLRQHLTEADFLRRVALEFSPMQEESQILSSIADNLIEQMGFRQAAFIRFEDGKIKSENPNKRVHGSIRLITDELNDLTQSFGSSSSSSGTTRSLPTTTGSNWICGWINPRLEKPCLLVTMPDRSDNITEKLRFIGNLSAHVSTMLDSRSLYVASSSDALTKVFNRRFFDSRLALECAAVHAEDSVVSLVLIDLDHFKKLNDSYGHPAGDAALKTAAIRLKAQLRSEDVIARVGGEEFAVLLPGTPPNEALGVAEKLRNSIAMEQFEIPSDNSEKRTIPVTASFGVAGMRAGVKMQPEDLYKAADQALYAAKGSGRNCVRMASAEAGSSHAA
jgi:diguanylate cyclase (GGDEF)-like protein